MLEEAGRQRAAERQKLAELEGTNTKLLTDLTELQNKAGSSQLDLADLREKLTMLGSARLSKATALSEADKILTEIAERVA